MPPHVYVSYHTDSHFPLPSQVFQSDKMNQSILQSVKMADLPIPIANATAVPIGRNVYLAGGAAPYSRLDLIVQVYNIDIGKWSTLPPAPQYNSEAIAINNHLVLIGGVESSTGKITNMVSTWLVEEEKWTQTIPPMSTRRFRPGVLLLKNYLFVFGGRGEDNKTLLDSFEVLNIEENQWSSGHGLLPQPLYGFKLGVFRDAVILTSAWISAARTTTKSWKIPVRVLEDSVTNSSSQPIQWTPIADTPYYDPSLLTNSKQPVLVGGDSGGQPTKDICLYTPNRWEIVGHLSEPRVRPAVVVISDTSFLVFSGHTDPQHQLQTLLKSVELITYVM